MEPTKMGSKKFAIVLLITVMLIVIGCSKNNFAEDIDKSTDTNGDVATNLTAIDAETFNNEREMPQIVIEKEESVETSIYAKILPDSASHYYTEEEIMECIQPWITYGYSEAEALRLARNEMYATYGGLFRDDELNTYFYEDRADLFTVRYADNSGANTTFTYCEQANISLIKEMENYYK